jgi:RNA12 protein/RNA recognition motif. (a.k.a. RRM, RBD, or RNP domain)
MFVSAEPNLKEGGLFLEFKYKGGTIDEAVEAIKQHVNNEGIRSSFNFARVNAFQVKGRPWVEDLVSRVPTSKLHVEFYGPDLTKESLFREFRVFGRIVDISLQPSSSKDTPRYASVEFLRKRAATSARNCIHGEKFGDTILELSYERNERYVKIWNWATSNSRISIFILLGVIAGISYTIFDPLRVFSVTNKLTGRYNLDEYASIAQETWAWAVGNLLGAKKSGPSSRDHGFSELEEQERRLASFLKESPESLILVSGPKGSGKSDLIDHVLANHHSKMVIR